MEAKSAAEADLWVKSIELVMSKSEEYLNLDRYVDEKVFTKITGKSLFKDYETILEEYRKILWEEEMRKRKIEEEKKIEEERKKLEEMGKKKAHKVVNKKQPSDLELKKVKSEMPSAKAAEVIPIKTDDDVPIQSIEHKSTMKNDTVKPQPAEEFKVPEPILINVNSEKIELVKKDIKPVNKEEKLPQKPDLNELRKESPKLKKKESEKISRTESSAAAAPPKQQPNKIDINVPESTSEDYNFDMNPSKSKKQEKEKETQPLLHHQNSDEEDDNFKSFGINQSNKSSSKNKLEESKDEISEDIANLIQLDNQRKESMYDLLMKKEESKKKVDPVPVASQPSINMSAKSSAKSSVKSSDAKTASERGYEADQSRLNSAATVSKTSMQTNRASNPTKAPETRVGEPITTSSCFGSCWNGIMGIFRRN